MEPKIDLGAFVSVESHALMVPMISSFRRFFPLLPTFLVGFVGCVHPNLPSARMGDDLPPLEAVLIEEGPLQGGYRLQECTAPGTPRLPTCFDEAVPGAVTPHHGGAHSREPDVPWPRFHPLPTSPVL